MTAPMRSFRVPDDEWQQWQAAAAARGLDLSGWVRRVVQAAAEREVPGGAEKAIRQARVALGDQSDHARREWAALLTYLTDARNAWESGHLAQVRVDVETARDFELELTGATTHTDAVLAALDGAE